MQAIPSTPADTRQADAAHLWQLLRKMLLIRRFEEKCAELYAKEKIRGFLHLYIGEEAVAVGVMEALSDEDNILSTYREHGHALARGLATRALMAEMYGKVDGCCRGRGGSMHLFDSKRRFFGGNAIVAGHLGMSVGMALAAKKRKLPQITCCFFGDGAAAEGEFHEAMNLAALWQVPLLFVCENNLYAMGTAIRYSHAVSDLTAKGPAYGIPTSRVDGMDVLAVEREAKMAVRKIRDTGGPYFLVCETYRFRAHSMFDAELYRSREEVQEWKKRDPIMLLEEVIGNLGIPAEAGLKQLEEELDRDIRDAVAFAEGSPWEPVEELTRFLYAHPY
ncbi:MAG TPA: pyruvate dehydrogenase (acetyl-transferring) E1 component subunit alpha [Chitinophagaceae bacterium]|nr:pyruvate dehydrogenase (acetyl-transferring) E1 component subunit alpha [Chitinophagaceae bacterium]